MNGTEAALPLAVLFAGSVGVYVASLAGGSRTDRLSSAVVIATSVVAFGLTARLVGRVAEPVEFTYVGANTELAVDALGVLLALAATGLAVVASVYAASDGDDRPDPGVFGALVLALVAGVVGIGFADGLFTLYVFFELMAIASYALVSYSVERRTAVEAGFKYLVMNVAGSLFAVFGVSMLFNRSGGNLGFEAVREGLAGAAATPGLALAAVFVVAGFGVKAAIVPMHSWIADAYSEAPASVSALLAGVATPAAVVAVARSATVFPEAVPIGETLIVLAAVTMTAGNLLAYGQRDLKRLLAYSSIPHIGYVLFGLGVGFAYGARVAVVGALFHLLANAVMKGGAFLGAGALIDGARGRGLSDPRSLDSLRGLGYRMPLAAGVLVVAVLGLSGVPPLVGFWGKLFIAFGAAGAGGATGAVLALVLIGNSFLSLGYYLPVVRAVFATPADGEDAVDDRRPVLSGIGRSSLGRAVPMALLLALTVALGVVPSVGVDVLADPAADFAATVLEGSV